MIKQILSPNKPLAQLVKKTLMPTDPTLETREVTSQDLEQFIDRFKQYGLYFEGGEKLLREGINIYEQVGKEWGDNRYYILDRSISSASIRDNYHLSQTERTPERKLPAVVSGSEFIERLMNSLHSVIERNIRKDTRTLSLVTILQREIDEVGREHRGKGEDYRPRVNSPYTKDFVLDQGMVEVKHIDPVRLIDTIALPILKDNFDNDLQKVVDIYSKIIQHETPPELRQLDVEQNMSTKHMSTKLKNILKYAVKQGVSRQAFEQKVQDKYFNLITHSFFDWAHVDELRQKIEIEPTIETIKRVYQNFYERGLISSGDNLILNVTESSQERDFEDPNTTQLKRQDLSLTQMITEIFGYTAEKFIPEQNRIDEVLSDLQAYYEDINVFGDIEGLDSLDKNSVLNSLSEGEGHYDWLFDQQGDIILSYFPEEYLQQKYENLFEQIANTNDFDIGIFQAKLLYHLSGDKKAKISTELIDRAYRSCQILINEDHGDPYYKSIKKAITEITGVNYNPRKHKDVREVKREMGMKEPLEEKPYFPVSIFGGEALLIYQGNRNKLNPILVGQHLEEKLAELVFKYVTTD